MASRTHTHTLLKFFLAERRLSIPVAAKTLSGMLKEILELWDGEAPLDLMLETNLVGAATAPSAATADVAAADGGGGGDGEDDVHPDDLYDDKDVADFDAGSEEGGGAEGE